MEMVRTAKYGPSNNQSEPSDLPQEYLAMYWCDFIHLIFYPVLKIDDHSFFFNGEREILFQKRVWIPFSWRKRKVKRLNTFEFQFLHNSETVGAKAHR